jgi:DNA-binding NarL/FixJ family response regulator
MENLRVLVLGEDPLARHGLARMLEEVEGLEVVLEHPGEEELPAPADLVLCDAGAGPVTSLESAAEAAEAGLPVLALLPDSSALDLALTAGARGLLRRDSGPDRLLAAARAVAAGLYVLDSEFSAPLRRRAPSPEPELPEALTAREREVLELLAAGRSNRQIAQRLEITEHTAKFHVAAILGKLGAHSRAEAVSLALRIGLLPL